jgi:hypothetical protein
VANRNRWEDGETLDHTAALVFLASGRGAAAQSATQFRTFKQWNAYTHTETDGRSALHRLAAAGFQILGDHQTRDPAFIVTTVSRQHPSGRAPSCYPFKDGSKVTVEIDGAKFTMFTDRDSAWIENPSQEPELISAMKSGTRMTVQGTSRSGTLTTDSYSLAGVTAALDAIMKACPPEGATQ